MSSEGKMAMDIGERQNERRSSCRYDRLIRLYVAVPSSMLKIALGRLGPDGLERRRRNLCWGPTGPSHR
jgi:hypothetical protein